MRLASVSLRCLAVSSLLLSWLTSAKAIERPSTGGRPSKDVYGGEPSATCNFPTTVALAGGWSGGFMCSGTLVHPEIVVYASHCSSNITKIMFGENIDTPARTVVPEYCRVYPEHSIFDGTDWAYCKLPKPIDDIPITPILMGCERSVLEEGKEVWLAGFGTDENDDYGVKRQATAVQHQIEDGKAWIGGEGKDECFGDSGSSAYVLLSQSTSGNTTYKPDGTWRVYSITSYTPPSAGASCGAGTYHSLIPNAVPWIETDSVIDVTPCHTADGTWAPGPDCNGFPREPEAQSGGWEQSCSVGATGGAGETCGPSFAP